MSIYRKESLETLRQRINLVEVLTPYVELKPSGSAYKGLCPFHEEKTPSFVVQKGDHHYHCFGCGAHGDAIQFLMQHLQMRFSEAIEALAEQFRVHLEVSEDSTDENSWKKKACFEALETASRFYHCILLHTEEGHKALEYLFNRGIDLDFICKFQIGFAPATPGVFQSVMKEKGLKEGVLLEAGLLKKNESSFVRDFFSDRITFPIHHPTGKVFGFSARKYKEETFGGKYINTPETLVFKKSKVLFGLNYSRRRIAKEGKAIIVEGQIDTLRLIYEGLDYVVAGQGTAFGEHQINELLRLGVKQVYLALDADQAGVEASLKIGNLFQKEGVEAIIIQMPYESDPDQFVKEHGPHMFQDLLHGGVDYLTFIVRHFSAKMDLTSPAVKNRLCRSLAEQIRTWNDELMVHESLIKMSRLLQIPEEMVNIDFSRTNVYLQRSASVSAFNDEELNPIQILEMDLLRWLLIAKNRKEFLGIAKSNLEVSDLQDDTCRLIYETYLNLFQTTQTIDFLTLASNLQAREQNLLSQILEKKVELGRAKEHFIATIQKILDRNWMEMREKVRMNIQSVNSTEDEILELCKKFDHLKNNRPKVKDE